MIKLTDDCCGCGGCFEEAEQKFKNTSEYLNGFNAGTSGMLDSKNPHNIKSDEWTAWKAGWLRASFADSYGDDKSKEGFEIIPHLSK